MTWTELKDRGPETGPFLERSDFHLRYSSFVDLLGEVEGRLRCNLSDQDRNQIGRHLFSETAGAMQGISRPEADLFAITWQLFTLKHGLFPYPPEVAEQILAGGKRTHLIESLGAPGSGKTIEAQHLTGDLGGTDVRLLPEPVSHNPFLGNPDAVLCSQLLYLLGHLKMVVFDSLNPGIAVSDTSFAYNKSFMDLRYSNGEVTDDEYLTYGRVVNLLSRLIPEPDVTLHLHPTAEHLHLGILERLENGRDERRAYEAELSPDQLREMIDMNATVAEGLRNRGQRVITVPVDPRKLYFERSLRYETAYALRVALDYWGDLITPNPDQVAREALDYLVGKTGQIVGIFSEAMFTAKTKAMLKIWQELGGRMILFQPAAAAGRERTGQKAVIGAQMAACCTEVTSNSLGGIRSLLEQRQITPETIIGIDELMLFLAHKDDPRAVIHFLEELSGKGYNLVLAGITKTFKETPFHYMGEVIAWLKEQPNQHIITPRTRCAFCDRPAGGTRRIDPDGNIARRDGSDYAKGDNYVPVCLVAHPSCVD